MCIVQIWSVKQRCCGSRPRQDRECWCVVRHEIETETFQHFLKIETFTTDTETFFETLHTIGQYVFQSYNEVHLFIPLFFFTTGWLSLGPDGCKVEPFLGGIDLDIGGAGLGSGSWCTSSPGEEPWASVAWALAEATRHCPRRKKTEWGF